MKHVFYGFVFLVIPTAITLAQLPLPEGLRSKLSVAKTVNEAIRLIDSAYNNGFNLNESEYKTYKKLMRLAYWAQRRQMPDGSGGDFNKMNAEALEKVEKQYGAVLAEARKKWLPYRMLHEKEWQQNPQLMAEDPNVAAMSAFGAWISIGPQNSGSWSNSGIINADLTGVGRVDRIAFHPTNSNILFVGTPSGGLWRVTLNASLTGATYTCISDNLPTMGISGIAVSPTNGNVIYVLTGDGDSNVPGFFIFNSGYSPSCQGVYRTTNGGETWQKMADFPEASGTYTGHKLTISNTNGNYLFAATSVGLYRTTDGAASWQRVRTGQHRDIEFKPGSDSVIYASTNNSVLYSTQGGRENTWFTSTFSHSVATGGRIELAVRRTSSNTSSNVVYALVGGSNVTDSTFRGIFQSTNSGVSFTRQTNTPNILTVSMNGKGTVNQSTYDLCIAVNPANANNIITGGIIIWRSTNGGVTMVNSSSDREGNGAANQYVHPDIHDVAFSPYNNALFAGHDGGLSISTDNGVSWTDISNGLAASQFYHFKMHDSNGDGYGNGLYMIAGAQDNGIKYRNNTGAFRHVACCDGYDGIISGKDPSRIYYNFNDRFYNSVNGGVTIGYLFDVSFFSPSAYDYNNPDTMYVGGSSLTRTFDAFSNRTTINTNDFRRILSTSPTNSARLYGSSGLGVYVSEDRGDTRKSLHTLPNYPTGSPGITDVKPLPTNSNEVFVTFGGYIDGVKVLRITNAFSNNATVFNISGNLPNVAVFCVCPTSEGIYVGTDIGVFVRPSGQTNWLPFYNGLPISPVTDIWANENGNLYASTFGRGIWFSARKSNCADHLNLSNFVKGTEFYQANLTITSSQENNASPGTILNLKANSSITLTPGFWAKQGTFFNTTLAPCDQGGNSLIFMDLDASTGKEVIYPIGLEELHLKKYPPLSKQAYMIADSNGVRFFLPGKSRVQILGRDSNGSDWTVLKEIESLSSGHFKLHFREAMPLELAIKLNGEWINPKLSLENKRRRRINIVYIHPKPCKPFSSFHSK
jgi:hypothetical protein